MSRALNLMAAIGLVAACGSAPALAAPRDDFSAACMTRPKATNQRCDCQAKLARTSFSQSERSAMIRAMKGDQTGFRSALDAMGDKRRQAFVSKMQVLKTRSDKECR